MSSASCRLPVFLLLLVAFAAKRDSLVGAEEDGGVRPARSLLPVPAGDYGDIAFNSTEGVALLERASHRRAWYQLAPHFETQRNQAFCSAATAVRAVQVEHISLTP